MTDETGGFGLALFAIGCGCIGFVLALAAMCGSENRREDIGSVRRRWHLRLPTAINRIWPPPGLKPVRQLFERLRKLKKIRFNWP